MRWGESVMAAVCYDVLNQVLFDKTVLSTYVFIVSPVSPSTKAASMMCERLCAVRCLGHCSSLTCSFVSQAPTGLKRQ